MCVEANAVRGAERSDLSLGVAHRGCNPGAISAPALLYRSGLTSDDSGTPWFSIGCSHCIKQRSLDSFARNSLRRTTRQHFPSHAASPATYGNTAASELPATERRKAMMRTL